MSLDALQAALAPLLDLIQTLDPAHPDAAAHINAALPLAGPEVARVRALVRQGVEEGWLCHREGGGVRFSRVAKLVQGVSIDAVRMDGPGAGHEHPQGEFDLCFAVAGDPRFCGQPEGWIVYPPRSWHVPEVSGGTMEILYFLPGGSIRFGPPA